MEEVGLVVVVVVTYNFHVHRGGTEFLEFLGLEFFFVVVHGEMPRHVNRLTSLPSSLKKFPTQFPTSFSGPSRSSPPLSNFTDVIYVKPFLPRTRAIKRRGCVKVIEAWPGEELSLFLSLFLSKLARFRHVPATVTMLNVWPGTEDVLPRWMRFRASISGRVFGWNRYGKGTCYSSYLQCV